MLSSKAHERAVEWIEACIGGKGRYLVVIKLLTMVTGCEFMVYAFGVADNWFYLFLKICYSLLEITHHHLPIIRIQVYAETRR